MVRAVPKNVVGGGGGWAATTSISGGRGVYVSDHVREVGVGDNLSCPGYWGISLTHMSGV